MDSATLPWMLSSALQASGLVFCLYISMKFLKTSLGITLFSLFEPSLRNEHDNIQTSKKRRQEHLLPAQHSDDFPDCGNNYENRITVCIQYSKFHPSESVYTSTSDGVVQSRRSSSTESTDDLPVLFSSIDFTQLLKELHQIKTANDEDISSQWSIVLKIESVDFLGHIECVECEPSADIKPVIALQSIRCDRPTLKPIPDLQCQVYCKLQCHWKECYIYNNVKLLEIEDYSTSHPADRQKLQVHDLATEQ